MERITISMRLQEHEFEEIWKKRKIFISLKHPYFVCLFLKKRKEVFIHLFRACLFFLFIFSNSRQPLFCLFCFCIKNCFTLCKDISKDEYGIVVKMWNQIKEKMSNFWHFCPHHFIKHNLFKNVIQKKTFLFRQHSHFWIKCYWWMKKRFIWLSYFQFKNCNKISVIVKKK